MNVFDLVAKISVDDTKFKTGLTKLRDELKSVGPQTGNMVQQVGAKMQILGKAFMPISMIAGAMLVPAVKGAMEYEQQISKVTTLLNDSQVDVKGLSKEFINLSNETGRSTEELTAAAYQALSAGRSYEELGEFVKTATNLSKAGFTDTATSVDILTTVMNAYGEAAGTADEIANKLVWTQNKGKTTVDELAKNMGRVIPTANAMNVSLDDLSVAYSILTAKGISTRIATTDLNAMFNELGNSGTNVGQILQEKTGMSFQDLMSNGYSLGDVLKILTDYSDETGTSFNELWQSTTAGQAALSLTSESAEDYNAKMKDLQQSNNVVEQTMARLETSSVKLRKAWNNVKNMFLTIGTVALDALAPAFDKISEVVTKVTEKFMNAPEGVQKFVAVLLLVATAIGPVLVIGGKLASVFGGIPSMFSGVSGAISSVVESFQILGMATIGPILAVVAAVAGIIAILVHAYNSNEEFRNKVNSAWENIKGKVTAAINVLKTTWDKVSSGMADNWQKVADRVMPIISALVSFIDGIIQTLMPIISAVIDYISTYISTFISVITGIIQVGMAIISGDWSAAWEAIKNLVSTVINGIVSIVSSTLNVIGSVIQVAFNLVLSIISTVLSSIWNVITSVWNGILTTIGSIVKSILYEVAEIWHTISTTISNIVNNIKTSVQNKFNSIKSAISNVVNSIKTVVGNAFNAAKTAMTQPIETAKNTIKGIVDKIKGLFPINILKAFNLPKLPSISISQGKKKVGPVEVPYPILSWNAKAMASGLLLNGATIFGMNGNRLLGGGEAGPELVVGKNNLMRMISEAQGGGISDEAMASMLQFMASNLSEEAITRAFVKGASQIDWQLIVNNREFGRAVKAVI